MRCEHEAGCVMILTRDRGTEPVAVNVERTTKTQILVRDPKFLDDPKRCLRFEMDACSEIGGIRGVHSVVGGVMSRRFDNSKLYHYSEETMKVLKERCDKSRKIAEEKRAAERERLRKIAEERAAELAEVKAEVGSDLKSCIKAFLPQPDGTRIYVLDVPVRVSSIERKKGWEVAMVRCSDVEELDWEKWRDWRDAHRGEEVDEESTERGRAACTLKRVEFARTYGHGGSSSFPSVSTCKAADDEEALWETLRDCYVTSW